MASKTNMQSKSKSKSKKQNTSSIVRNIFKNSYFKDQKLIDKTNKLSKSIKSENDLKKYLKQFADKSYENYLKKLPELFYLLIALDNKIGFSKNSILSSILTNQSSSIRKVEQVFTYLNTLVIENPTSIFKGVSALDELLKMKKLFQSKKGIVRLDDRYVWANLLVFIARMRYQEDKSLEQIYIDLKYRYRSGKLNDSQISKLLLIHDLFRCQKDSTKCSLPNTLQQFEIDTEFDEFFTENKFFNK